MPIRHAIWKVADRPQQLVESSLANEKLLEKMILADPRILSEEWMLIGQQVNLGHGPIDLLALAPDASLVLIELKRDKTPRDVMAQALDYAASIENLRFEEIAGIYSHFASSRNLTDDFRARFNLPLDEDALNQNHQIIIVASSLDDRTERIVAYLSKRHIPINVLFFQIFSHGQDQLISRSWLLDPVRTQLNAATPADDADETWNGEFYACFGEGQSRSWAEAVKYGFICAGGGEWYSDTLDLLTADGRVWVKAPGYGFVGVGRVAGVRQPASSFLVKTPEGDQPALGVLKANYHRQYVDDLKRCEYFVPMKWLDTVPIEKAVSEVGLFGNQNTVCRPKTPKWQYTVSRLKERFPKFDSTATGIAA
jgi:hypothetical protein